MVKRIWSSALPQGELWWIKIFLPKTGHTGKVVENHMIEKSRRRTCASKHPKRIEQSVPSSRTQQVFSSSSPRVRTNAEYNLYASTISMDSDRSICSCLVVYFDLINRRIYIYIYYSIRNTSFLMHPILRSRWPTDLRKWLSIIRSLAFFSVGKLTKVSFKQCFNIQMLYAVLSFVC